MATSIVSFINMKGGVGKTTLCANIGYTLVKEFKKKVLIIDMDPQFNATQLLMTKFFKSLNKYQELRDSLKTINYILQPPSGGVTKAALKLSPEELICQLLNENKGESILDLIPGDLEIVTFESSRRGSERILNDYITECIKPIKDYDYILIDTPATYSIYSQSALIASNYYLVPVFPDAFSVLGFNLLKRVMKDDYSLKENKIEKLGLVFTLAKDYVGRKKIFDSFQDKSIFSTMLEENERIRSGNISSFMWDMKITKNNISKLTSEFIERLKEKCGV